MTNTGPERDCNLMLEGGITSGIVYPALITELSKTFRFRQVGGTSAGAIGAACAAAAELARQRGEDGFARLDAVATFLKSETDGQLNLQRLFQPQAATQTTFDLLAQRARPGEALLTAVRAYPRAAVAGSLPGVVTALAAGRHPSPLLRLSGTLVGLGLGTVGGAAAASIVAVRAGVAGLKGNHYGLCSGADGDGITSPALTSWLVMTLDQIAGVASGTTPLTFGLLSDQGIDLQLITTCLSHSRPYRLPFRPEHEFFYFKESEFRVLFPARVVDHLKQHPRPLSSDPEALARRAAYARDGYFPLPLGRDLPVAVAVRMSLSFPVLISTVPLHVVAYSQPIPAGHVHRPLEPAVFTDGGLTSNFPLTLFESPLPARPTFAVNLRSFPQGHDRSPVEAENVWRPESNASGTLPLYERVDTLGGAASALLNTMKNWGDSLYIRAPAYRDAIIHISLAPDEGGLNLAMSAERVTSLIARGQVAAQTLTAAYLDQAVWDNHRRIRLLSLLSGVGQLATKYAQEFQTTRTDEMPWPDVLKASAPYRLTQAQQQTAQDISDALETLGTKLEGMADLSSAAPKPAPTLSLRPDL